MLEINKSEIRQSKILYSIDQIQLQQGDLAVIIGANGAGKSTLLNAIATGENQLDCRFDNKQISKLQALERAKKIALVETRFEGLKHLSTQEYLELGRFPHTGFNGRLSEYDFKVVTKMAESFQLTQLLQQSTDSLSDGERQRAAITRAIIQETPILLLDEPTSFLDYPSKRETMKRLLDIAKTKKKMILMASHDIDLCMEYSTTLLIINPISCKLEQYKTTELSLEKVIEIAFPNSK